MKRSSLLVFLPFFAALGGCAVSAGGLGKEAGPVSLPAGMTLTGSRETDCQGTLHVGEDSVENRGMQKEFYVDPGENAAFRLRQSRVEWACISDRSREFDRFTCPQRSSYVRITRASGNDGMLLECFG